MPVFSIVIPSYNNAEYLSKCISSLQRQTFEDWEAIIVVDGSPDNAAEVAYAIAAEDSRVKVINKKQNEGTHRARKTGVKNISGQYALFLDADDELTVHALSSLYTVVDKQPVEVLHFGTELFGEDMPEDVCKHILAHSNADFPNLYDRDIPAASFVKDDSYRQDWRVLQRLYDAHLLKKAFALTTDERLGRGQDSYEWLVISSQAHEELMRNDIIAYRYYLGRGITTFKPLSREDFIKLAKAYQDLLSVARQYSVSFRRYDLSSCVQGLKIKIIQMLAGDWKVRVSDEDKMYCAQQMASIIGSMDTAAELMRLVRDDAYELWVAGKALSNDEHFLSWYSFAENLVKDEAIKSSRYADFCNAAKGHINDLRTRQKDIENKTTAFKKLRNYISHLFN